MSKIKSWVIQGKCFNNQIVWPVFDGINQDKERICCQCSIIYGPNGSGKSTFIEGVRYSLEKNNLPENLDVSASPNFESTNSDPHFFFFDDKFKDDNIGFAGDAKELSAIVMFGENVQLEHQIAQKKQEIKKYENENEKLEIDKEQQVIEKENLTKNIKRQLSNFWATREQDIKGLTSKGKVELGKWLDVDSKSSIDNEIAYKVRSNEFAEDLNTHKSDKKHASSFLPNLAAPELKVSGERIDAVLKEDVFLHALDGLESGLKNEIEAKKLPGGEAAFKHSFIDEDPEYCPFCMQKVPHEHVLRLRKAYKVVFSKETQNAQADACDLIKSLEEPLDLNLKPFPDDQFKTELEDYNNALQEWQKQLYLAKEMLKEKAANPFDSPTGFDVEKYENSFKEYRRSIILLNEKGTLFNERLKNLERAKAKLLSDNIEMALYEIREFKSKYQLTVKKIKTIDDAINTTTQNLENARKDQETLYAKEKNNKVAMDEINESLRIIFGSADRLYLQPSGDNYEIYSHKQRVSLLSLSTGEKNAIALAYFFTWLSKNKSKSEEYREQVEIFIDDPVSSFDAENKLGVISFLSSKLNFVSSQNSDNQTVVLTHDRISASEIYQRLRVTKTFKYINIANHLIFDEKSLTSSYNVMMFQIFKIAEGLPDRNPVVSSVNEIRQVAEAYFNFNYANPMPNVMQGNLLEEIGNQSLAEYFKNSFIWNSLNNGSHAANAVKYNAEWQRNDNINAFSQADEMKLAKDFLTLIYCLSPNHVLSCINAGSSSAPEKLGIERIKLILESWKENLKNSA